MGKKKNKKGILNKLAPQVEVASLMDGSSVEINKPAQLAQPAQPVQPAVQFPAAKYKQPKKKFVREIEVTEESGKGNWLLPEVEPLVFLSAIKHMANKADVEISGYGHVEEREDGSQLITYMGAPVASGSSSHVSTSAEQDALGTYDVIVNTGGKTPNLHYHTHPGFSAYFSSTDETDMLSAVSDASKMLDEGTIYFLVVGGGFTTWFMRSYRWNIPKGEVVFAEANVWLDDVMLDVADQQERPSLTSYTYTYDYTYGNYSTTTTPAKSDGPTRLSDDGDTIVAIDNDDNLWINGVYIDRSRLATILGYDATPSGIKNCIVELADMYPSSWSKIANQPLSWNEDSIWSLAYSEPYPDYISPVEEAILDELEEYLGMPAASSLAEIDAKLMFEFGLSYDEYLRYGMTILDLEEMITSAYYETSASKATEYGIGLPLVDMTLTQEGGAADE